MMRLWRSALLRELLLLGPPGAAGGGGAGPGAGPRRLPPPLAALGLSPPASRRGPGPPPSARGLCTRSEGALEEPGKGAQAPPPTPGEPPADSGHNNNHGGGKELAGGGGVGGENKIKQGLLPSLEDLLFYTIAEGQEKIPVHKFITALKSTGLRTSDPRLKECMDMLRLTLQTTSDGVMLDKDLFKKCVQSNIVLLTQAFRRKFVIPDFMSFTSHIDELYESAKKQSGGKVADYIPQLAKFSPDLWGVSLCTVDGQRHSVGDTKVPFCLQSCVKPLKYAIAVNDLGTEYVHRYVGKEPSGLRFNKLFLNEDDRPHNPMVNAGAIVITSLIKVGLPAKSGVAGGILLVVPNVMGLMCWSPPLDKMGNSVKGIHFCHDLVSLCNFHNYDNLRHFAKKLDPRREGGDQRVKSVINLLFAAYTGDVSALRRFALSGMDMEQRDYDSRTALHVAAAEGHVDVVKFLLEACKVNPFPKDRWNNTPMDEALHFGHHDVFKILQEYQVQYTPSEDSNNGKENRTVHKNLDGLL
ncbi:glutaminase kidney isoform, mitochondrial isoform 2-T2 [Morus bassanus]